MMTVEGSHESEIDRLAALQQLDCQLKDKRDLGASLRQEADEFEKQLGQERAQLAQLGIERAALDAQRRDLESRLEIEGAKIRDNRMRQNRVRNEREVLALQREIDLSKEATRQNEEVLLSVMEMLEQLDAKIGASTERLKELDAQMAEQVTARREKALGLERELEAERGRRDALIDGMNATLRVKYEQIFERRGGSAVVVVRQGVCTGCHMNVPPQMYNELQKFRDIRQCPNCHRILFYRPENAATG
jgi:predicted  nucleic acid-binding Zn-ribbon protein